MRSEKGTSLGGNASLEPSLNHGNRFTRLSCGGEQENNIKGDRRKRNERKGKPCIKSHKSFIFYVVMGTKPLA
jgi:hypothetical protein